MCEELLVKDPAAVELAQLDFHVDVAPEELVLRALADGRALRQHNNALFTTT